MDNKLYHIQDIEKSYQWLGHNGYGYTQLIAFHKDYKPGRQNYSDNIKKKALPKIWYAKQGVAVIRFVEKYHGDHTCCYGINPRPVILQNKNRYNRSAREDDILIITNIFFDIDFDSKAPSDEQIAALRLFLFKTEPYFESLGISMPLINFSGRGYHLLFSPAPISVEENPDIKKRLVHFLKLFREAFSGDIAELGASLDNVMDLSRVVKIYGTRKPGYSRISRFEGSLRIEDHNLKSHLLAMELTEDSASSEELLLHSSLPDKFSSLLRSDEVTQNLWNGQGKSKGDTSSSGYDFSLVKHCMRQGITDIADLATILALRSSGSVQTSSKDERYIRTTIANAIRH